MHTAGTASTAGTAGTSGATSAIHTAGATNAASTAGTTGTSSAAAGGITPSSAAETALSMTAAFAVGAASALPKGLQPSTMRQIVHLLQQQRSFLTAEEVADGVGLARVTARRYLDYLVQTGCVRLDIRYGSVGRPVNRYGLISPAESPSRS
ncbi:helix-turn-helix domain-containing protein [Paenibacillus sp. 481]|uniref:helix-turn-helix domain-containing protein n=1 Tax=Paenibacillus sp. 481 TaxID=2835869 RepID=UPI002FC3AE21